MRVCTAIKFFCRGRRAAKQNLGRTHFFAPLLRCLHTFWRCFFFYGFALIGHSSEQIKFNYMHACMQCTDTQTVVGAASQPVQQKQKTTKLKARTGGWRQTVGLPGS